MRLNAYLASAGIASRRKADELIKAGRVTVNGEPGQLNDNIESKDKVQVDGKPVSPSKPCYILLYKPPGFVSTMADPQGRPTVIKLIDVPERVVPVGRLDLDTTGAMVLTNDGDLANKLMHPRYGVDKAYEAEIEGTVTGDKLNKLSNGIKLDGKQTAPAKVRQLSQNKVELVIHEGRKHQVKKMLAQVGLPVKKLHRSKYGSLTLEGLKPGEWRELTDKELKLLK